MKIESEWLLKKYKQFLSNRKNVGEVLNDFTDQFRDGRDPWEIIELINHKDDDVVEIGLFVLNEIIIEDENLNLHLEESLSNLIKNRNSNIRFRTYLILSQLHTDYGEKEKETNLYLEMIKDEDKHIRKAGKKLMKDGHLRWNFITTY